MPGATGLSHDAAGNLTSIDGKTLTYDALGQLTAIAVPNSGTVTITYDPAGRRFSSTDPGGVTTYYDYDGSKLIGQQIGSGSGSPYADIIDSVGTFLGNSAQYEQYGPDGYLDSLYSSNGTLQEQNPSARDAFGNNQEGPSGVPALEAFGGGIGNRQRRDADTGFHSHFDDPDADVSSYGGLLSDAWNKFKDADEFKDGSDQRRFTSDAVSMLPGVGKLYDAYKGLTGRDPIAGTCVPLGERLLGGLGALGDGLGALGHLPIGVTGRPRGIAPSVPWNYSRPNAFKPEHVFSPKHIGRGIMKLGDSQEAIINSGTNSIERAHSLGLLKEGSNQIHTVINGEHATIRTYFSPDGRLENFDIWPGTGPRIVGNLIDFINSHR